MLVELIKRAGNLIKNMFSENNLAAAQIAQIFGSELLKVQQNAQTDSGHQPEIVKLNPKQFLVNGSQYSSAQRAEERRIIEALQKEAEATHPLPVDPQNIPAPVAPTTPQFRTEITGTTQPIIPKVRPEDCPPFPPHDAYILERIATSLERIANSFERFDIKPKKKTVKRKLKSNKSILLNETSA